MISEENKIEAELIFDISTNKLEFCFNKKISDALIVVRELDTNLKSYEWRNASFDANVFYFIFPSSGTYFKKLTELGSSGLVFSLYSKEDLIYEQIVKISNIAYSGVKFHSDRFCDVKISDWPYTQYADFIKNELLNKIVKKNHTVIDVGANCGAFAAFCASKEVSEIFCLEPGKSFYILEKTFKENPKIHCFNYALSDKIEEKYIFSPGESNTVLSSFMYEEINKITGEENITKQKVKCVTLDYLIEKYNIKKVDLLKVDIEGYEYNIFKNTPEESFKNINSIFIEYHHNTNYKISIILNKLRDCGYNIDLYNLHCDRVCNINEEQGVIYAFR